MCGTSARFSLERVLAHCLEMPRANMLAHLDDPVSDAQRHCIQTCFARLAEHEPIQYILGETWFMGERFRVTPDVLIPRFDTEVLVRAALARLKEGQALLDVCTGSGIVPITVALAQPGSTIFASDVSEAALSVAKDNAQQLGASIVFRQGDLLAPWAGMQFAVITANPPYITPEEYETLAAEVQREPKMALLGGPDGLDFYRRLVADTPGCLRPGGYLLVEIGATQGDAVTKLFAGQGFSEIEVLQDEQFLMRVVCGRRAHESC